MSDIPKQSNDSAEKGRLHHSEAQVSDRLMKDVLSPKDVLGKSAENNEALAFVPKRAQDILALNLPDTMDFIKKTEARIKELTPLMDKQSV